MKQYILLALAVAAIALASAATSCTKEVAPETLATSTDEISLVTKTNDSDFIVSVYVETNDVNPLNAMDYYMADGSQFVDIVELFASNIHVDSSGDPCLYFNDKLTPVMQNASTYITPLQNAGIKVVLSVLGDWAHMGVASMTDDQAQQFAEILAYVVNTYNLDGIGFDDEYADYASTVSGSYGNLIEKVRDAIGDDKLITVFQYGNYSQISSSQGALIDYAYTDFTYWNGSSSISGVTNDRWMPCAYNLGSTYSSSYCNYVIKPYAAKAKNNGYAGIMFFNLRPTSDVDPLSAFQAVSNGALSGSTISCTNGDRSRDAGSVTDGYTITYDMISE